MDEMLRLRKTNSGEFYALYLVKNVLGSFNFTIHDSCFILAYGF